MAKILMIVSAAGHLTLADGTSHPTGYWAEEVAASHKVFRDAGVHVDIATPAGASPAVDPVSLDSRGGVSDSDAETYRQYLATLDNELTHPLVLGDVDAAAYDAVYLPGGHAPMSDLAFDAGLGQLLDEANARGQIIGALCHGPAALVSAQRADGSFVFEGRQLTVFSDEEERQGGLGENTPWWVERRLRELGAKVTPGEPWTSVVVEDANLITGQNPQSSVDTAKTVLAKLGL